MDEIRNTEENKSYIRCPQCDKMLFQAIVIVDCIIKCEKCHRRYLVNVQDGSVSIKLISKPKDND